MTESRLELTCRGCGADEYSATDLALKCQYCSTLTEIPRAEEKIPDAPDAIVPLSVSESELTDAVYEHLASGDLTPDHLLEHATFIKKERFYAPVYAFVGSFEAQWTASFGYDRTEHYTVYETRTENGHSRQVPVTKSKTVTDWNPVNGDDSGRFSVYAYAGSRNLTQASVDALPLVEDRSIGEPRDYEPSYATGVSAEAFAHADDDAYRARGSSQVDDVIDASVRQHAQGDSAQRDWHWTANIEKRTITLLVPVCHAVYEFEGKQYNVWMSGADASRLVADPLPVDQARKSALGWGMAPLIAALVSGGLAIFKFDATWGLPIAVAVGTALYAGIRHNAIVEHSKNLRQSLLAARRAASSNTAAMSAEEQKALLVSVKRPDKPKLFSGTVDKAALSLATIAGLLLPGARTMLPDSAAPAEAAQVAAAPVRAEPSNLPPVEYQHTAPEPAPVAVPPQEAEAASAAAATVASSEAPPSATQVGAATPTTAAAQGATEARTPEELTFVTNVLGAAAASMNWAAVDEQVGAMKAKPPVFGPGDRKLARAANNDGLGLLKAADFAGAIAAFERGRTADPGDVELRNNLAYALLKSQDSERAIAVLASVLMQAPDRSSAWANLAEALANPKINPSAAQSALRVAVRYSANREKTLNFLRQTVESPPSERFKAVAGAVLAEVDSIPRSPNDRSLPGDGAVAGAQATAVVRR